MEKPRPGLNRALRSFAGNNHLASQESSNATPSRHNSVTQQLARQLSTKQAGSDVLSEELKVFLKEKQEEFLGLVRERKRLRTEITANDIANASILEAFLWFLNDSKDREIKLLADALAWKSIALGASRVLEDKQVILPNSF